MSSHCEGNSERSLILWPSFTSVWADVEAWVHSGICAEGSFMSRWLDGGRWMRSELADFKSWVLSLIQHKGWQEPRHLRQLRCALSSCANLVFVQMHGLYLVLLNQNKLSDTLQGCLGGVQTWVLFEGSQNLGVLFSWHLLGSRSVKYNKNCFEQGKPKNMRFLLQDERVGEIL